MKRHVIIGRYGSADNINFIPSIDEIETHFDLLASSQNLISGQQFLDYGIGHAINELSGFGIYPSELGIDILVLATHVFAADTRISRFSESQDGWTREIRLIVPVPEPEKWTVAAPIFVRMLNFLTGDKWNLLFRPRPHNATVISPRHSMSLIAPQFDDVALFSGGLDSLIGAINSLEKGRKPLFISHASEGATSDAQSTLFRALKRHYPGRIFERLRLWMSFPDGFVDGSSGENTTRGRSFLFFALGIFAASGLGRQFSLKVPENGLIAINVPLDPLRLGALSTRTTHPFYISRWNEALHLLGINGFIENPYWNMTKGEMVSGCSNIALLSKLLSFSLSCSSPVKGRWQGLGVQHCGYCLPCIIRRSAIHATPLRDTTMYTIDDLTTRVLNTRQSEGVQIRSFQVAIHRIKQNPELANILIHKPGPLFDESVSRQTAIADVYKRGLEEVEKFIKDVRTKPQ